MYMGSALRLSGISTLRGNWRQRAAANMGSPWARADFEGTLGSLQGCKTCVVRVVQQLRLVGAALRY